MYIRRLLSVFAAAAVLSVAPLYAVSLTAEAWDYLQTHDSVIEFVCQESYPPFEFVDENGESSGMAVELVRWLATELDFRASFSHVPLQQAQQGVLSGRYDVMTTLFHSENPDERFNTTPVLFNVPVSVFIRTGRADIRTPTDLNGKTIAMQSGDYAQEFLDAQGTAYTLILTRDTAQAVDAVMAGRADALIGGEQMVFYSLYAAELTDALKKIGEPLYVGQYSMAVASGNEALLSILNKGVEKAKAGGLVAKISRKWLGIEYTPFGFQMVRYIRYIGIGVGLLLAALLLFWIWDVRLAHRVQERTRQLQRSEERLRTVFQNSPDAIFIEDEDGTVLEANPVACAFHKMSRDELVGRNIAGLIPENFRKEARRELRKWFTGEMKRYEGISHTADGREVPVEIIGAPMRYEGKTAVLLLVRDMTDRRSAELALRESELRYRGLVEAQNSFIVRVDPQGRFTFVNEAFCRFVGRTRVELIGQSFEQLIDPADLAIPKKAVETLLAGQERVVTVEHRMRTLTHTAWVNWENIAVCDEDGLVTEIQCMGHDITERRRIREALQESEKRLQFLFEGIPHIAVQGYSADRKAIYWNRASEKLYGYSKQEVLRRKIEELVIPPERRTETVEAIENWVENGVPIPSGEVTKHTRAGEEVAVYTSRLATHNQRGEWEMYVVDVDLSELKRAERELLTAKEHAERANRAKTEFLANMSHELRTPMNGMMGMTQLLLENSASNEQRESLETIMESARELMRIIDELLDISCIEAGEVRLQPAPFNPRETVEKAVLLFTARAGQKGIDLSVAVEESVPSALYGDAGRIRQIFINLISNALKFTHEGRIEIRARAEDQDGISRIFFEVADTGIGIPPDKQKLVFEKFMQVDASLRREYGGAGLGLSITRRLVELMGGTISVESEIGKGSVFRFDLLLAPSEDIPLPAPEPPPAETVLFPANILLVEDNLVNRKVAAAMLKKLGCRVTTCASGAEAVRQLSLNRHSLFDMIFMDCQMPGMDGFETTRSIRRMVGALRDIPIVAMTAHALEDDRRRCLDAGMDDYLAKPVSPDALIAVLQKYCG
jgi:PAS domain S-box-containing protein